ncbi:hypothetical protein BN12_2240006 [Nostocoides japonicum T1-X7]|uniref:Uncharacterized protein n=4 Tax=Micrococcales TaxID=85006 RepID=A0A077LVT0_9MICO|nr:hypothetical protein BN12_2240006 [Tetrasphaera japonica T1-X7]
MLSGHPTRLGQVHARDPRQDDRPRDLPRGPRRPRTSPSEDDEGLDDAVLLGLHEPEPLENVVEGEGVGRHERRVEPAGPDEGEQSLHTVVAAGAQAGVDRLVGHPHAEGVERHGKGVGVLAVVADVRDATARLRDSDAGLPCLRESERLDGRVDPLAARRLLDLLDGVALGEVDDVGRAERAGQLLPLRDRLDGEDAGGTEEGGADRRAQADGALGEDGDGVPEPQVAVLGPHETGREHVAGVDGRLAAHRVGDRGEVGHGIRHREVLRHVAVDLPRVLVAAERSAALAGEPGLAVPATEARGDGVDGHPLPLGEAGDVGADGVHEPEGLVAERAAGRHGKRPGDRVGVRGADERVGRPHDDVVRPRLRDRLLRDAGLPDLGHDECSHRAHGRLLRLHDDSSHLRDEEASMSGARASPTWPSWARRGVGGAEAPIGWQSARVAGRVDRLEVVQRPRSGGRPPGCAGVGGSAGNPVGCGSVDRHTGCPVRDRRPSRLGVDDRPRIRTEQRDVDPHTGVIGFDIGRLVRGSGSRRHGHLVNAPCKPIGANSKRTDFALAA